MLESKKFYFLLKENLEYIYISVKIFNSLIFQLSTCFLLDIHKSLLYVIFSEKFNNRTSALVTKNLGVLPLHDLKVLNHFIGRLYCLRFR